MRIFLSCLKKPKHAGISLIYLCKYDSNGDTSGSRS